MWTCPSQRRFPATSTPGSGGGIIDWLAYGWGLPYVPGHHVFNMWSMYHLPAGMPASLTRIRYPAEHLLIQETEAYDGWGEIGGGAHIWVHGSDSGGNFMVFQYGGIHAGNTGHNIIWADSHASFKTLGQIQDAWYRLEGVDFYN